MLHLNDCIVYMQYILVVTCMSDYEKYVYVSKGGNRLPRFLWRKPEICICSRQTTEAGRATEIEPQANIRFAILMKPLWHIGKQHVADACRLLPRTNKHTVPVAHKEASLESILTPKLHIPSFCWTWRRQCMWFWVNVDRCGVWMRLLREPYEWVVD